ncbi:TetR family transcriptional regulator [Orenia metallireducens]|jgi:AcrR family transcriptional regulator|uniref:TetR family transcriptional regulator n=1 Tax=Orenia metallireducens TaxID=1413210 RepID=A0A1C0A9Q6_9FIRM|nr:TetR/AcrR family transcriptional regulator [Orenia metallireducens]OCL27018.1 TetR family transcriptional regulator [Orenia metallireducens]
MNPKKEKIFAAAIQKFAKKGTSATTMQEIAEEAGIGKGTLYRYFKNKEDLISSLIKFGLNDVLEKVKKEINKLDDPIKKIEQIIIVQLNFYKNHGEFHKFLTREVWGHKLKFKDEIKEIMDKYTEIIEDIIIEGIEQKKLKEMNPLNVTISLFGMIYITSAHRIMFGKDFSADEVEEIKGDIMEIYFNGIIKE